MSRVVAVPPSVRSVLRVLGRDYGSQSSSWCCEAMITTTVRIVQSTMEAMPTARLMKEKLRASRDAISADTISPRATAVRTWRGNSAFRGCHKMHLHHKNVIFFKLGLQCLVEKNTRREMYSATMH